MGLMGLLPIPLGWTPYTFVKFVIRKGLALRPFQAF